MNGKSIASCTTAISEADKQSILTIEGLADGNKLHPVQQAFIDEGAFQCGYCTAGMIMGTVALLKEIPKPTDVDIVSKMNRHICRCCSYPKYMAAIHRAAEQTRKEAV